MCHHRERGKYWEIWGKADSWADLDVTRFGH